MSAVVPIDELALHGWIVGQGLASQDGFDLLAGLADRLVAAGVPLWRLYVALPTVSPDLRAASVEWRRGRGTAFEGVRHDSHHNPYAESPFKAMLEENASKRRWRLGADGPPSGFPVLEEVRRQGGCDHVIHLVSFDATGTLAMRGAAISFTSDDVAGFDPEDEAVLERLVPVLGLATFRIATSLLVRDLLGCYVGRNAAGRVLRGEIRRGVGHTLSATILFADLRGFTAASETGGPDLVAWLGRQLDAVAAPIEDAGGEVLKIMGDGLLAAFPDEEAGDAGSTCAAALGAALDALARNAAMAAADPTCLRLDVALHRGEVFYGNIGAGSRLDFTVIGPAVNEAARIEGLCDVLGHHLLVSAEVAACCGRPLLGLGRHRLRGVGKPRELFTLPETASGDVSAARPGPA